MDDVKHFWNGFKKQANASGALYMRDLVVDTGIHSMQEDSYPEGDHSFFNPDKSFLGQNAADPVETSNAGQPPRYLGVDTYTLGYAEPGV